MSFRSKILVSLAAATVITIAVSSAAFAHHSFAMYDMQKEYVFTGIVVRIAPSPDHQQLYFVPLNDERKSIVRKSNGDPYVWMMEMEGAAVAAQQGVTVEAFAPGTIFSVGVNPLRNGEAAGTRGDGAGQAGASAIFMCPKDMAPAAGMHCDTVQGSKVFGEGDKLPDATDAWTPPA